MKYSFKNIMTKLWSSGYLFLFIIATYFISFNSSVSSPFGYHFSGDSDYFILMGKMILEGKIPYVDFFDHKGPSLMLIHTIIFFFHDSLTSLYVFEILNLFAVLVLIFKIAKLVLNTYLSYCVCLLSLMFLSIYWAFGNTTEEWSLFFIFLPMYFYFLDKKKISGKSFFIIGLCISFLLWFKATHILIIGVFCLSSLIYSLLEKDYSAVKTAIKYLLLGQIPLSLLYFLYFAYHGAVYDLLYGTFIHNFMYVGKTTILSFNYDIFANQVILTILPLSGLVYYSGSKNIRVFILVPLLMLIALISVNIGSSFDHYFLLTTPLCVLASIFIFSEVIKVQKFSICVGVCSVSEFRSWQRANRVNKRHYAKEMICLDNFYNNILSDLTFEERQNAFYYNVTTDVYMFLNFTPNYKYFGLQEWMGYNNPKIFDEINETLIEKKPKWIVVSLEKLKTDWFANDGERGTLGVFNNIGIVEILNIHYESTKEVDCLRLYKLK